MESKYAGTSAYNYGNYNPLTFNDPTGTEGEDMTKGIWYSVKNEKTGFSDVKWYANTTLAECKEKHEGDSNYGESFKSKRYEWNGSILPSHGK